MTEVNLNAGKVSQDILVQALDAKDGKVDGKISASVWNEFVKDKGGKTIKNFINSTNAEKSISTYLAKNSKISGKDKNELAAEWFFENRVHSSKVDPDALKKLIDQDLEARNKQYAKNPDTIQADSNDIINFINGKQQNYTMNKYNAAEVFLKVLDHFEGESGNESYGNKVPLTMGTHLYLSQLYPILMEKADELNIGAYYKKDTNFGDNMEDICKGRLEACRELAVGIYGTEHNIRWTTDV